jgi:hypothetical protein
MKIKETLFSVTGIFILYIVGAMSVIMAFRFFFPQQPAPLLPFSVHWRLIGGVLNCITMFPALVFSALIIPFGIKEYGHIEYSKFSPRFLDLMKAPVITAISGVTVYGLLFLLVFPVARDYQSSMSFQGQLFRISKDRAMENAAREEWPEAARFIGICERIWPENPETASLKTEITINFDEYQMAASGALAEERYGINEDQSPNSGRVPGDRTPVDAAEALSLAEKALTERRYYDAHWLATLGSRLARPGSVEMTRAALLASSAWNELSAIMPNTRETEAYSLYYLKREAYEAMISGDWIRGYYSFKDLSARIPTDPDVVNFLTQCEQGVSGIAFFTDELELTIGDVLTEAVFSFPGRAGGRMVARISSLSVLPDFAYGIGFELLAFDLRGGLSYSVEAPYVKILPLRVQGEQRLVFLTRALDRQNRDLQWRALWTGERQAEPEGDELVLNMGFDDFLLITRVNRGVGNLFLKDLVKAAGSLEDYGYVPQVFEGEILRRISEPVMLLPLSILVIIIGWRFRAKKHPRYIALPMLLVLPLVFNGFVYAYRHIFAALDIGMILTLGFPLAAVFLAAGGLVVFIAAVLLLAAQHG